MTFAGWNRTATAAIPYRRHRSVLQEQPAAVPRAPERRPQQPDGAVGPRPVPRDAETRQPGARA